jgi:hypothetical protein
VKLHNGVAPSVNVTVPLGLPTFPLTVAEYVTGVPTVTLSGPADAEVIDLAGSTCREKD